jgi:hypothetical protein
VSEQHVPPPSVPAPAALRPRLDWRERIFSGTSLSLLFGALAVGAAAAGAGWKLWLKPQQDLARLRFETTADVLTLYALETRYKRAKGVYANDLDALLAQEPDAAARKSRMGTHLDLSTLAVVGDAKKFKIEANVLDAARTLIKIRGPLPDRPTPRAEGPLAPETGLTLGADGRPIAPEPPPSPRGR